MNLIEIVLSGSILLIGTAFLMHIAKESKDAHGSTRK